MLNAENEDKKFSLAAYIAANKKIIDAKAIKNPTISKGDEWRKEDFWDELAKEKASK